MTNRERVMSQLMGEQIDRVPLLGGWFHGIDNLARLAGLTTAEYLENPVENLIRANRGLGVDCMISPLIPTTYGEMRTDRVLQSDFADITPEHVKRVADEIPGAAEDVIADFDFAEEERECRREIESQQQSMGDIVWIPTFWEITPAFELFGAYGYDAYFSAIALYPDAVGKLYWASGVRARARGEILVRLYKEYDLPPICFMGPDICNNKGPLCSPDFLKQYYFPLVKRCLEPFVEADIRVIRHCDGDVMPLIDDFIDSGYAGFQGFQFECGVDPWRIAERRSVQGRRLIFFAGLSVTHTLPFGTIEDVAEEIEYVLDFTDGGKNLFFFTSSAVGPEAPLENIRYAYDRMKEGDYDRNRQAGSLRRTWPWFEKIQQPASIGESSSLRIYRKDS